jgi:hypothetical protein
MIPQLGQKPAPISKAYDNRRAATIAYLQQSTGIGGARAISRRGYVADGSSADIAASICDVRFTLADSTDQRNTF